jgi:mono/diheme cytochrome c family protein
MRKVGKILLGVLGLLLVAAGALAAWIQVTWDRDYSRHPTPVVKRSTDPEVIKRGEYVVHALAHCTACHTPKAVAEKLTPGARPALVGGQVIDVPMFGRFVSPNLTSDPISGLGAWTDEEIARAIGSGVSRDGHMRPFMALLGPMADEDLTAVVSYLRTLAPADGATVDDQPTLIGKLVIKGIDPRQRKAPPYVAPGSVSVERGRYLALGPAGCAGCHSASSPDTGLVPQKPYLAGPLEPTPDDTDPGMEFAPPNLTPDPKTGHIYNWDENGFVSRFKAGRVYKGSHMPWEQFGEMTEEDVRSIYRFLRSLPPTQRSLGPTHRPRGYAQPS